MISPTRSAKPSKLRGPLSNHFLLSSGLRSPSASALSCFPNRRPPPGSAMAWATLSAKRDRADLVVSPAMGGLFIGQEVARALDLALLRRRDSGIMTLRRGFSVAPGQRVVVIGDVVTTGKSSREVMNSLRAKGAAIVGLGSIVDRGGPGLGVPTVSLLKMRIPPRPRRMPALQQGQSFVKPGSRAQPKI